MPIIIGEPVIVEILLKEKPGVSATERLPELDLFNPPLPKEFQIDRRYGAVYGYPDAHPDLIKDIKPNINLIVVGYIPSRLKPVLLSHNKVYAVWGDPDIEPHNPPFCSARITRGTAQEVAEYLGADCIWSTGNRGVSQLDGPIKIGIVDTGVRRCYIGDSLAIQAHPHVPGGVIGVGWFPPDTSFPGDDRAGIHGSTMARAVLTVCPEAEIIDIGILKGRRVHREVGRGETGVLSNAIFGFDWAIQRYKRNKADGPHVLSNSWGFIYHKAPDYAEKPEKHPFTQKVYEAIAEKILVCFCATNCGTGCPGIRICSPSGGPGNSIWGANALPLAITIGAATIKHTNQPEQWIGYSGQGPANLQSGQVNKPDICAPSQFAGPSCLNYASERLTGTSTSCAVVAGILGLLKAKDLNLIQQNARDLLITTSTPIHISPGQPKLWDPNWGHGMLNARSSYVALLQQMSDPTPVPPLGSCLNQPGWNGANTYKCPCFIATAAFGSTLDPHVEYLRNFRDTIILQSRFRPSFDRLLDFYYTFSPFLANKMEQSLILKKIIRLTIVSPLIWLLKSFVSFRNTLFHDKLDKRMV